MPLIMKSLLKSFLILGTLALFWWMNTATSKINYFPCESPLIRYSNNYTPNGAYYILSTHDTIVFKVIKDTLLDQLADDICSILKDSCKMNGFKILIRDTTIDQTQWNTRFGKQVFFRICP